MNLESFQNFMIVALTCSRKSLRNRFWQEALLPSGIKSFYLFSSTWFVKHIFFYIFNALTSLLQENANLFCRFKDERMAFPESQKIFICCRKEAFHKPITPCHDYLSFFLPSLFAVLVGIYFFTTLYIMTSRMSTFLSRQYFQFIFFLLNKTIQLPFHDYIAFLFLP